MLYDPHHPMRYLKLLSRIRTPLAGSLNTAVDIIVVDEGAEIKAGTDGRRAVIGGTEVAGPGARGGVTHERIVPLSRIVVEHSIGDGVAVVGATVYRYDPLAVVEALHAGRGAADQLISTNMEVIVQDFTIAVRVRESRNAQRRKDGDGADHGKQHLQLFHTLPPFCNRGCQLALKRNLKPLDSPPDKLSLTKNDFLFVRIVYTYKRICKLMLGSTQKEYFLSHLIMTSSSFTSPFNRKSR